MKLRTRITSTFLATFVVIVVIAATGVFIFSYRIILAKTYSYLYASNISRAETVRTFLQSQKQEAAIMGASAVYRDLLNASPSSDQYPALKSKVVTRLQRTVEADPNMQGSYIIDAAGGIVVSSDVAQDGVDASSSPEFTEGSHSVHIGAINPAPSHDQNTYSIAAPITSDTGKILGVSVLLFKIQPFNAVVSTENGMGSTEENFLINKDLYFITPSRFLGEQVIMLTQVKTKNAQSCFNEDQVAYVTQHGYQGLHDRFASTMLISAKDYRNVDIIGTHAYIPEAGWCLITKVDKKEIFNDLYLMLLYIIVMTLGSLIVFGIISTVLARQITRPLDVLEQGIKTIQDGDLTHTVAMMRSDEIGVLSRSFDAMTRALKQSRASVDKKVREQTKKIMAHQKDMEDKEAAMLNILDDIKDEKDRSQHLAQDLEKYKMAVANAAEHIVITDAEGIVLYANMAAERITGFSLKEIFGKKAGVKALWGGTMPTVFYKQLWATIKKKKQTFSGEILNHRKNGDVYVAYAHITPILNEQGVVTYFVGIERDVTQEKKQFESMQRMTAIVEGSSEAIISKKMDGTIISWNKGAEKLYGFTEREILGKPIEMIVPQEKTKELEAIMKDIQQGKPVVNIATLRKRKDGTTVEVSLTVSPVSDTAGTIVGASTIAHDISKEKEIDRAKTEFVSLASHQLRTPLSAINWYTEMLLAGDVGKINADQKSYLEEVYRGNKRMVELVNALLNVSRIDLGTFAVEPASTSITETADDVIKELQQQIILKKIKITTAYATLPKLELDPKLMRIVFQNLLSNAVKYTPEKGTIAVSITKDQRPPKLNVKGPSLYIKVADTGYGIPAGQKDKIFTKLFRADNVREKEAEGTGLGLYIVKAIVKVAHGTIWFDSTENKGTTFHVLIPFDGMVRKQGAKDLS
jgi:PAS domain S-box-containing protein